MRNFSDTGYSGRRLKSLLYTRSVVLATAHQMASSGQIFTETEAVLFDLYLNELTSLDRGIDQTLYILLHELTGSTHCLNERDRQLETQHHQQVARKAWEGRRVRQRLKKKTRSASPTLHRKYKITQRDQTEEFTLDGSFTTPVPVTDAPGPSAESHTLTREINDQAAAILRWAPWAQRQRSRSRRYEGFGGGR